MKTFINPPRKEWGAILARPVQNFEEIESRTGLIMDRVKSKGDQALFEFTERFDGVRLKSFEVTEREIEAAKQLVSTELKAAIQVAKSNIEQFHKAQKTSDLKVETMPGVNCYRRSVPIEKVGLYIPGGTAPLFSTVLMLGVPAGISGCKEVILCTPPDKSGSVNPAILYTADLVGIKRVFKVGGAQAIAAMCFGTESISRVDKIFGPGNQYVTMAKQLASRFGVAIDMPAGPSEVAVYADETAMPEFVAADLLSQAEHGVDSQVLLVASSEKILSAVRTEIQIQLSQLTRREIAQSALENSVALVLNIEEAVDLLNEYAPEHLILSVKAPWEIADQITNAGSVFIGNYTPESAGDYASGTNHTLPTNGFAKAYSGVSLDSFVKKITYQEITQSGLLKIGPVIEAMAAAERLDGHKNAVSIRLKSLNDV